MSKSIAAILSALTLSFIYTLLNEVGKDPEKAWYYSFSSQFIIGFLLFACIYIFIAIPVTFLVDGYLLNSRLKSFKIGVYFLIGAMLGLIFLIVNPPANVTNGLLLILQFGLGGLLFSLYQAMFKRMGGRLRRAID